MSATSCPNCNQPPIQFMVLSCGHSLCQSCIDKLSAEARYYRCPFCQLFIVNKPQPNFLLNQKMFKVNSKQQIFGFRRVNLKSTQSVKTKLFDNLELIVQESHAKHQDCLDFSFVSSTKTYKINISIPGVLFNLEKLVHNGATSIPVGPKSKIFADASTVMIEVSATPLIDEEMFDARKLAQLLDAKNTTELLNFHFMSNTSSYVILKELERMELLDFQNSNIQNMLNSAVDLLHTVDFGGRAFAYIQPSQAHVIEAYNDWEADVEQIQNDAFAVDSNLQSLFSTNQQLEATISMMNEDIKSQQFARMGIRQKLFRKQMEYQSLKLQLCDLQQSNTQVNQQFQQVKQKNFDYQIQLDKVKQEREFLLARLQIAQTFISQLHLQSINLPQLTKNDENMLLEKIQKKFFQVEIAIKPVKINRQPCLSEIKIQLKQKQALALTFSRDPNIGNLGNILRKMKQFVTSGLSLQKNQECFLLFQGLAAYSNCYVLQKD